MSRMDGIKREPMCRSKYARSFGKLWCGVCLSWRPDIGGVEYLVGDAAA